MNLWAPWCVKSTKSNTESLNSSVKSPPFDLPAHWIFWFSAVHPPCILLKDSIPSDSSHPLMLGGRLEVWFLRVWIKEIRITPYPVLTGLILHEKWNHSSVLKVRVKNKQTNHTKNSNHPTPAQPCFFRRLSACWGGQSEAGLQTSILEKSEEQPHSKSATPQTGPLPTPRVRHCISLPHSHHKEARSYQHLPRKHTSGPKAKLLKYSKSTQECQFSLMTFIPGRVS